MMLNVIAIFLIILSLTAPISEASHEYNTQVSDKRKTANSSNVEQAPLVGMKENSLSSSSSISSTHQQMDEHERVIKTFSPEQSINNDLSNNATSETVPPYMQHTTLVLVILHLSVFISGLVGNSLVCLSVYRNKSLQTVTNYYIVNLAVADFLVILICLPPTVYWDLTLTWDFGLILCKLVPYLQSISVSVSVLTLTCISIDRWYAICRPLEFSSTKSRAKVIIGLIWLLSMLIASPDVMFLTTRPLYEENDFTYMDCTYSWPENNTKMYQLCIVTLLFVGPFVLMTVSYSHIVNVLWRNENMTELIQHSFGSEDEQQLSRRRNKRNSMLLMMVNEIAVGSTNSNLQLHKQQQYQHFLQRENRNSKTEISNRTIVSRADSQGMDAIKVTQELSGHLNVINCNTSAQSILPDENTESFLTRNLSSIGGVNLSTFETQVQPTYVSVSLATSDALNNSDTADLKEGEKASIASSSTKNRKLSTKEANSPVEVNVIASSLPIGYPSTENHCKLKHKQLNPQLAYERINQFGRKHSLSQACETNVKKSRPIVIAIAQMEPDGAQSCQVTENHKGRKLEESSDDLNVLRRCEKFPKEKQEPTTINPIGSIFVAPLTSSTRDLSSKTSFLSSSTISRDIEPQNLEKIKGSQCTDSGMALEKSELAISGAEVRQAKKDAAHLTLANDVSLSDSSATGRKCHRGYGDRTSDVCSDKRATSTFLPDKGEHISCVASTFKSEPQGGGKRCWKCLFSRSSKKNLALNEDKFLDMSDKSYKRYRKNLANYAARRVKYGVENSVTSTTVGTRSSLHRRADINNICSVQRSICQEDLNQPALIHRSSNGMAVAEAAAAAAGDEITTYSGDDVGGSNMGTEVTCNEQNTPSCRGALNQNCTSKARFNKLIESRKKAAKMLIVIVIMFGLCYLPVHFLNILRYTIGLPQNDITTIASLVSHWLCYFNSAINPLIYNLMSGKYRLLSRLHHLPATKVNLGTSLQTYFSANASGDESFSYSKADEVRGIRFQKSWSISYSLVKSYIYCQWMYILNIL